MSQNSTWRADSGFKNGYLQQMEIMLEEKLPGSKLKASPHIESRIKNLKGKYSCLAELLSLSGFSWDNEHSLLLCEKSAFDEYVKKRKDASGLYGKPFPYYNKLAEIYGRDRATGTNAGNADDDEEEIRQNDATGVKFGVDDNIDDGEDDEEIDEFDGVSHTQQSTNMHRRSTESTTSNQQRGKNKKTKVMDEISTNVGALADSISNIVPKFQGLIDAISDKDVAEMQTNLFTEISKINGLTPMQCIQATNILAKEPPLMRVFYAISDEMKLLYILNMLQNDA
ncbi:hypothetical protein F8388_005616 [Cannabis sativa]|uniref:Myb/SANT-like domain-containing protein n=1 Tax=Cannabis sativa TaxID=3483 RepID=A0A7J6FSQ1_CANSA|nr:hypothetical protein F8388_005616 [Cannabis sativa]KAF4373761.1 hypothetical protein G4B88_009335 [Cannabis sativa]